MYAIDMEVINIRSTVEYVIRNLCRLVLVFSEIVVVELGAAISRDTRGGYKCILFKI